MKTPVVIAVVLVALVCLPVVGQARDYKETIGPYWVNLTLPDNIATVTEINKNIEHGETLDGTPFTAYVLEFPRLGTEYSRGYGYVAVRHYDSPCNMDLNAEIELAEGVGKGDGYLSINSARRVIDGHDGIIVEMLRNSYLVDTYRFAYQINNRTIVEGTTHFGWNAGTLQFLKTLHVKAAK